MPIHKKYYSMSGMHLIIAFIVLRTINQVLFKKVAIGPGGERYLNLLYDTNFYYSTIVFLFQTIVWLLALKKLPLSVVYPFTSLTFITIMISGLLFFGESITLGNLIGGFIIIIGILIIAKDHNSATWE